MRRPFPFFPSDVKRKKGNGPGTIGTIIAALAAAAMLIDAAVMPGESAAEEANPEPFRYDSGGRRDPFVPLFREGRLVGTTEGVQVDAETPALYGILWDPQGDSIALINDAEVRVGDTIAGFRVKAIQRDAVVLDGGGKPVVLRITYEPAPSEPSPGATTGGEEP
ncbi:MAG: hypothetical protein HYT90_01425 [Candidatus Omnitrophica bacterium]|nr:hypothetical protein [Candidatus Omnitrophota bacterium]